MKRPLFAAALCAVFLAAVWLESGAADQVRPGYIRAEELNVSGTLLVTGQVYQKDETSVYLRSVVLSESTVSESAVSESVTSESILSKSDALGESVGKSGKKIPCQDNFICETQQAAGVPLGSTVTVEGIFSPFLHAVNPGEFDSAEYYMTLGIGGKVKKAVILERGEAYWPVREGLYRLKCLLRDRLYDIFSQKDAAIMSALLLGDKKGLDDDSKDLYKRNGILHILSISSLHITIIGMSLYKLLRRMRTPVWLAALGGSTLLLLYGGMTGFSVSACRAIGMYLIKMLGEMAGRTYDMLTALGVMGAVMAAANPYYLHSSGFLLSFASVLGIGALYPAFSPKMPRQRAGLRRMGASVCQSFFASLSITLATLPIQLWFYYEVPVYSVILNLFVIPFMKPMMIIGLLAMGVPGLGGLGVVNHGILEGYGFLCRCFDLLPFHTWNPGCPKLWQIGIYYLLLGTAAMVRLHSKKVAEGENASEKEAGSEKQGLLREAESEKQGLPREAGPEKQGLPREAGPEKQSLPREAGLERHELMKGESKPETPRKYNFFRNRKAPEERSLAEKRLRKHMGNAVVAGLVAFAVLLFTLKPPGKNSVTFLDVGQGDCILVRVSTGQTYLFDCGSTSRSGVGEYVLLPCLKYYGIRSIDALFLSHPDADHVNGALELLAMGDKSGIAIRQLVLPAVREADREKQLGELVKAAENSPQGSPVLVGYLSAGESWDCGGAVFTCLHPARNYGAEDANQYSECLLVEFGEKDQKQAGQKWTLLLTGDVEGNGEEAMFQELRKRNVGGLTVLKAAHHGSRNSTSEELLAWLTPKVTVISCGRDNRYGHPHKELLERLEASGTFVLQTAQRGAITIVYKDGKVRISTYL